MRNTCVKPIAFCPTFGDAPRDNSVAIVDAAMKLEVTVHVLLIWVTIYLTQYAESANILP